MNSGLNIPSSISNSSSLASLLFFLYTITVYILFFLSLLVTSIVITFLPVFNVYSPIPSTVATALSFTAPTSIFFTLPSTVTV